MQIEQIHQSALDAVNATLNQAKSATNIPHEVREEAIAVSEHILVCLQYWRNCRDDLK